MKQDEIIEMARQAGMYQDLSVSFNQSIQNFAKLVAAKEREECAKACTASDLIDFPTRVEDAAINKCSKAIRARGEA